MQSELMGVREAEPLGMIAGPQKLQLFSTTTVIEEQDISLLKMTEKLILS